VQGEPFFVHHARTIDELRGNLLQKLADDPKLITGQFQPSDLAVDDRRRGAFVFAGGDEQVQLRKAIDRSLRYFAREWLLAQAHGAEYVAPWPYEQYLCQEGLDKMLADSEHYKTVNAILQSRLPVFQGLSPKLVADIRDDAMFVDFRANLFEVYRAISGLGPSNDFSKSLAQTEETLLRPVLERAQREATHGFLRRLGVQAGEITFSMGARVIVDSATQQLGWHTFASEGVGVLADRVRMGRTPRSPLSVWTKLYRHQRKIADELRQVKFRPGSYPRDDAWAIDEQPSMNVRTTPGLIFLDDLPLPPKPEPTGYSEGNYRLCDCGSGQKWKFCCQSVPERMTPLRHPSQGGNTFSSGLQ
jgi:hypothetical protein